MSAGLTENNAYPRCHAKFRTPCSFIQMDDPVLISDTTFAAVLVVANLIAR